MDLLTRDKILGCYEVQISAVTIKNGLWSGIVQQRTSEDGKLKDSLLTYSAIYRHLESDSTCILGTFILAGPWKVYCVRCCFRESP